MHSKSKKTPAGALLICTGGGIGDSLLASVVARALRGSYTHVDALTLPSHRGTLERVPDLDGVLVDDGEEEDALSDRIGDRNYAAAIVTWATARAANIALRAGIPVRVGQARRLYSGRFTDRVVVRSELGDVTSHWTDILLDYARALACDTPDHQPRFVPTAQDDADATAVLEKNALRSGEFFIVHPTNAIAPVRGVWPSIGWITLVKALQERFAVPVGVSGTSSDVPIVREIVDRTGARNLAATGGIGTFGSLAKRARAYVGITTGVMHVAAAVGCPTVGIFPFQSDFPERWAPLGERTEVVRASYPCHRGDTKETCPDYACIANLDVPRILAATEMLLR